MSGALRFRFAAVLILAGLASSSTSANPLTALFAPEETSAPAPAKDAPANDECLLRPGKPVDGQHWMYHLDGHRRCWFQAPEGTASVRKPVHHHAAKRRLAVADEDDAASRKRKAVVDAHAEMLRPAASDAPQPAPPTPAFQVADAASVPATGAAALVPPPPVLAKPDHPAPDQSNPPQDKLEALFAATPADSAASAPSETPVVPVAAPIARSGDDGRWWTSMWAGPLLMALGLVLLLGSTPPVRRTVLAVRNLWAREPEDRRGLPFSETDSQTRSDGRHPAPATPRRPRQAIEDRRKSTPSGQALVQRASIGIEEEQVVRARVHPQRHAGHALPKRMRSA